ncbi:hypothetical protein CYMTET_31772 [Cymbomonas tetramitiformis]|uniref:Uncharacterized protein n=1 Tax=Cymbomonas tetramitiformis TaxID=36881 RepID=A0AAE0FGX5_9CHLO|nr:hypothetical protein CYMTET_31772 [Cymbomonas tetramitiformis]
MAEQHKERVNMNVSSLSKKLLEGWTLLSESCPNSSCNVPLVRNKAQTEVFCVSCEQTFDSSIVQPGTPKRSVYDEQSSVAPVPMDHTPGPVTRSPLTTATEATVQPPRDFTATAERYLTPLGTPAAAPVPAPSSAPPTAPSPGRGADRQSKSDKQSSLLAEKLLQGWTLLNEYCQMESCLAPLVRSRDKRKYCVSCGMYVVSEAEAPQAVATNPAPSPLPVADAAAQNFAPTFNYVPSAASSAPVAPHTTAAAAPPLSMAGGASLDAVRLGTVAALTSKLDDFRGMLVATPLDGTHQSIKHLREIITAISETCQSLSAVKGLQ